MKQSEGGEVDIGFQFLRPIAILRHLGGAVGGVHEGDLLCDGVVGDVAVVHVSQLCTVADHGQ